MRFDRIDARILEIVQKKQPSNFRCSRRNGRAFCHCVSTTPEETPPGGNHRSRCFDRFG